MIKLPQRVACDFSECSTLFDPRLPCWGTLRALLAAAVALRDHHSAALRDAVAMQPLHVQRQLALRHGPGNEWRAFASDELLTLDRLLREAS